MSEIFFITSTLPKIHGGRTKSLLQRAYLLNKNGVGLTILSTNYNPEYQNVYSFFREQKKVLSNTHFENIYDFYKESSLVEENKKSWESFLYSEVGDKSDYIEVKRSTKSNLIYFYRDGVPKFVVKESQNKNVPVFFSLFHDWNFNPDKKFLINQEGIVHRIDTYNNKNKIVYREYLNEEGRCYLTKKYDQKGKIDYISLDIKNGTEKFSSEKEFMAYFFNQIFAEDDVVINDARLLDIPLLNTRVKKRIFQLHSSHLIDSLNTKSGIKKSYSHVLNSKFPSKDIIVSLTNQQKLDIVSEFPNLKNNIVVIPHSTNIKKSIYNQKENHFGIISRLDPMKNIEDAIQAFYLFNQEKPGFLLDIYGNGESFEKLNLLTKSLNIDKQVIFHGNVQDVDKAYQQIFALLITSKVEGFALMALESIANGTPVITYKVNYGPTDIIDNDSGWISEFRTPESLKEQMFNAVKKPKERSLVKKRALEFSESVFVNKWLGVINDNE